MPFTTRDGHRIHYEVQGDPAAPPLLLIMGLALSAKAWDRLPGKLVPFLRVITFDNRGCGESDRPLGPYRITAMADDAAAVLDACLVPRAHVLGISMGGMIAQELALRHPHRVDRLALGCTHSSWVGSRKPPVKNLLRLLAVLAQRPPDTKRLGAVLVSEEFLAGPGAGEALARWRQGANDGRAGAIGLQQQLVAVALHHTTGRLEQLRAPTLVITGDQDRVIDARESHRLARLIPGSKLKILAGAGHVFPLERERETVEALLEHFLGGVPPGALAEAAG